MPRRKIDARPREQRARSREDRRRRRRGATCLIGARQLLADHRPVVILRGHVSGRGKEGSCHGVRRCSRRRGMPSSTTIQAAGPVHSLGTHPS